ncbi:hypothetical protein L3X38_016867 [Prunus dulcis]|uniref:Uncharacterized protein n=1 Tax=Prunus dulcis TaxID=3755 RepID=A0AAD4Z9I7_PRUDU|nr:hypothetical protein L3X38_016867 [Prunus dulcis]
MSEMMMPDGGWGMEMRACLEPWDGEEYERRKMEAWLALADFQQLDESFVRLLGCSTEEKMGRDGGIGLRIKVFYG